MKFYQKIVFILFFVLPSSLLAQLERVGYTEVADEFPVDTKWINYDTPLSFSSFRDKLLVIHTMDLDCIDCIEQNLFLDKSVRSFFHTQLITVFDEDTTDVLYVERINDYIKRNHINHPVAIMPGFKGLKNIDERRPGITLVYLNKAVPFQKLVKVGMSPDLIGLKETFETINKSPKSGQVFATSIYQSRSNPDILAQALIEFPTYLSEGAGGQQIFVTDAGHDRIVLTDSQGDVNTVVGMAGGGFVEGPFDVARFNGASGTAYNEKDYVLYIADTYNHRLRVADFKDGQTKTVLGNGVSFANSQLQEQGYTPGLTTKILDETEPFGYPTDVLFMNGKVYVASAEYNQIFEFNPTSKSANELVRVMTPIDSMGAVPYISNLSAGKDTIYCVLSDGSVYAVALGGEKPVASLLLKQTGLRSFVQVENYLLATVDHKIYSFSKSELKVKSGSGVRGIKNGKASKSMYSSPFDLVSWQGQAMISDAGNHTLRTISLKKGKSAGYHYFPGSNLWRFADATSHSESASFDPIHCGVGADITIKLDLGEYKLVPEGHNEVHADGSSPLSMTSMDILENQFTFSITNEGYSGAIFLELFLTVQKKNNPDSYFHKRAFLNIPIEYDKQGASAHERTFKPLITD